MLEQLTENVRECLAFAAEAKQKADDTPDPTTKAEFLKMEGRWLRIARSFAFSERLNDFTAANVERLRHVDGFARKLTSAPTGGATNFVGSRRSSSPAMTRSSAKT